MPCGLESPHGGTVGPAPGTRQPVVTMLHKASSSCMPMANSTDCQQSGDHIKFTVPLQLWLRPVGIPTRVARPVYSAVPIGQKRALFGTACLVLDYAWPAAEIPVLSKSSSQKHENHLNCLRHPLESKSECHKEMRELMKSACMHAILRVSPICRVRVFHTSGDQYGVQGFRSFCV